MNKGALVGGPKKADDKYVDDRWVIKKTFLKYFNPHFLNEYSCLCAIITKQKDTSS